MLPTRPSMEDAGVTRITALETADVRFPTSLSLDGSDAMNPDPDYSAAYVQIHTDARDGIVGHGFVFTIGRGNDVQVAAIQSLADHLVGREWSRCWRTWAGSGASWCTTRSCAGSGPEKGVMHMAIGAVVNALWDLKAKRAGQPLWQLLAGDDPRAARRRSSTSATSPMRSHRRTRSRS